MWSAGGRRRNLVGGPLAARPEPGLDAENGTGSNGGRATTVGRSTSSRIRTRGVGPEHSSKRRRAVRPTAAPVSG